MRNNECREYVRCACRALPHLAALQVYRLLVAKTYEMHMFKTASKKLGLDQAVLSGSRPQKKQDAAPTKAEVREIREETRVDVFVKILLLSRGSVRLQHRVVSTSVKECFLEARRGGRKSILFWSGRQ